MGWFYGFKLHLIIFCLTSGNVDDRDEAVMNSLTKEIFGKLFADRGCISQKLFEKLLEKDIKHSRHRSIASFFVNLVSALAAYSFLPRTCSHNS